MPRKPKTSHNPLSQTPVEKALALLQQAGYTITPPNLAEEALLHQETSTALGFKTIAKQQKKVSVYRVTLTCQHSVNGITYGPGIVESRDRNLLAHLKSQDQLSIAAEHKLFEQTNRTYLIIERHDSQGRRAPYLHPVAQEFFNGDYAEKSPVYQEL